MNWAEKVERLQAERGFSFRSVELRAGLRENSLASDVAARRNISVSRAVPLARTLGVSADWLFDDEQGWPPPAVATSTDDVGFRDAVIRVIAETMQSVGDALFESVGQSADSDQGIQRHRTTPIDPNAKTLDEIEPQTEVGKRLKRWAKKKVAESKAAKSAKKGRRGA